MPTHQNPRCSAFIATSLDGFIARPDGSIDWLIQANATVPSGEDCGYKAFMSTVDVVVMGRCTFEKARSFADWPFSNTPVWVMSSSLRELPEGLPDSVTLCHMTLPEVVQRAKEREFSRLYIDGGQLIQSFLREGLLHDITVTTVPVLLGDGRRLFGPTNGDVDARLASTIAYAFGFVQNVYEFGNQTS